MKSVLMTGVTGTVGGAVLRELIAQRPGLVIYCLVRPQGEKNARERLSAITERPNVHVIAGDVTLPWCGMTTDQMTQLSKSGVDTILHCAASINLSLTSDAEREVWDVNYFGTEQVVALAELLGAGLHFVSTMYIAGTANQLPEAHASPDRLFRNPYEGSKAETEELVIESGLRFSIYRLGIVIGDAESGAIGHFSGYYSFFAPFWELRALIAGAKEEKRARYQDAGIFYDGDWLHLPVSLNCSANSRLSLVPIDWVARTLVVLLERPPTGKFFHLVPPDPRRVEWVIERSLEILHITGVRFRETQECTGVLAAVQRAMDRATAQFLGYITHEAAFATGNVPRVLGDTHPPPPTITPQMLRSCLEYAIQRNFGRE